MGVSALVGPVELAAPEHPWVPGACLCPRRNIPLSPPHISRDGALLGLHRPGTGAGGIRGSSEGPEAKPGALAALDEFRRNWSSPLSTSSALPCLMQRRAWEMGRPTAVTSGSSLCSGVALQVPRSPHVVWAGNPLFLPFFPRFTAGSLPALPALAPGLAAERGEEQSCWGQATSLYLCLPPLPGLQHGVLGLSWPWLLSPLLAGKSYGWGSPSGKCGGYRWGIPGDAASSPHPSHHHWGPSWRGEKG